LAVMTDWNSLLARHSSALFASWAAHGIGALSSLVLVALLSAGPEARRATPCSQDRWPVWSYLGGIPGAFAVLLAAITVNSILGLSGTLALMLIGQMVFSITADAFGFFGLTRRRLALRDMGAIGLVLCGSMAIIAARH
ncbi:MAG: DMT family transporter, partial [Phyllobacterium sp.]